MMKQITADLKKWVETDPQSRYSIKINTLNSDIEVGYQYNGDGMYRALQINHKKTIAITPWVNKLEILERAVAAAGLELTDHRTPSRKSVFLYVDGVDVGIDVLEMALARNKSLDEMKQILSDQFSPAQVQFKVECR